MNAQAKPFGDASAERLGQAFRPHGRELGRQNLAPTVPEELSHKENTEVQTEPVVRGTKVRAPSINDRPNHSGYESNCYDCSQLDVIPRGRGTTPSWEISARVKNVPRDPWDYWRPQIVPPVVDRRGDSTDAERE